ncbi:Enolase [Bienertia sinuspersici]
MLKEKTTIDVNNPLFLHPSENVTSLGVEKLQGASDYRAWSIFMEISLAVKRKLGFVTGLIKKDKEDAHKAEQWETCDNMLERTFNIANGSRKYKVEKELMDTQQNGGSIYEYYTQMKSLWEEEDAMNAEKRLFLVLNGVDEDFASMRTQMLMRTPLPSVEDATSIQQEEMQNEVETECATCGGKGHSKEKCWTMIGYPMWHPKYKRQHKYQRKEGGNELNKVKNQRKGMAATAQTQNNQPLLTKTSMISCYNVFNGKKGWIVDSEASDHMVQGSQKIKALGKEDGGRYELIDVPSDDLLKRLKEEGLNVKLGEYENGKKRTTNKGRHSCDNGGSKEIETNRTR